MDGRKSDTAIVPQSAVKAKGVRNGYLSNLDNI